MLNKTFYTFYFHKPYARIIYVHICYNFLLPKISIGGEYGWGFAMISKGGGSETTVSWDAGDEKVETETQNFANDSESGFLFDNATGSLVLKMYF